MGRRLNGHMAVGAMTHDQAVRQPGKSQGQEQRHPAGGGCEVRKYVNRTSHASCDTRNPRKFQPPAERRVPDER